MRILRRTSRLMAARPKYREKFHTKRLSLIFTLLPFLLLLLFCFTPLTNTSVAIAQTQGTGGFIHNVSPFRLYDSRCGGILGCGNGQIQPGQIRTIQATGYGGVSSTATAVLANLTIANAVNGAL